MLLSYSGAVLFLLAVASAQHLPEHLQAEVVKGRAQFRELLGRNVLFDIQNTLQHGNVALTSALAINGTQETATVSLLTAGQFSEITRVTNILRETNAAHCVSNSLTEARIAIDNSGAIFENCVNVYLPELRDIIDMLTALELSFRTRFVEQGPATIRNCAWDNFNSVPAVVECIDRFLGDFSTSGIHAQTILRAVEAPINQALTIIPTCTDKARSNATNSLNAILNSIRTCARNSWVWIYIARFDGYRDELSNSVQLALTEFSGLEGRINYTSSRIAVLIDFLALAYERANRVTSDYIDDVIQRNFLYEISIIRNATLANGLTSEETACVNKANTDMNAAFNQGESVWLACAKNLGDKIAYELYVIRRILNVEFVEKIRSDGIAAFMACVTQNNANATAANEYIRSASARLWDYLTSVVPRVEAREQIANNLSDALRDCRTTFLTNTGAKLKTIINALKTCVPKLGIQYGT